MSTTEEIVTAPVAPIEPVIAPMPAAGAPAKEPLRETIAKALQNPQARPGTNQTRPRDPAGKFAGTAPNFPTPETAAPSRPAMPKSLRLELQPHWDAAPMEFASAIAKREEDFERGVTPLKEKARVADELMHEFKPYEELMRAEGGTPATAIRQLLSTAKLFRTGTSSEKAYAVAAIMRQYQISPENLQQVLSGTAPSQPMQDPRQFNQFIDQRVSEAIATRARQQNEEHAQTVIGKFAEDPAHSHFDAVSDEMALRLQSAKFVERMKGKTEEERLQLAYEIECNANPEIKAILAAEQQAKDAAAQQLNKAKNAAVQVKGAPIVAAPPKPDANDRRATIANALRAQQR